MPAKKKATARPAKRAAKKPVKKPDAKKVVPPKAAPAKPSGGPTPQSLRGMKDILPSEQKFWGFVRDKMVEMAEAYSYERIDTPILEATSLFVRSVGKQTDVVEKEMFSFEDRGGDNVSLRPEGTASAARAYINHGMVNLPQPVKLYYIGPMFRYERPQHGRTRQHHQFGVEVFGDDHPIIDAEVILLSYLVYKELGVKVVVHINSLGSAESRPNYLAELTAYYRSRRSQICEDCKRRLAKNPLRLLDCKDPGCSAVKEGAPHIVDYLDEASKNHLMRVLEYLDDLQVPYVLNPHLVRGFDYYSRTVFELLPVEEQEGGQTALGGGGRYDSLVEDLGGRPTPACGFGIGVERAILFMKSQGVEPPEPRRPDIFLAQLGDTARRKAFALFEEFRSHGIKAAANFSKGALKNQLEIANRLGARYTLILGQKEVLDGTVLIRDMESGMQEIVDLNKAVNVMKKNLGK